MQSSAEAKFSAAGIMKFGKELPKTATGKVQRFRLREVPEVFRTEQEFALKTPGGLEYACMHWRTERRPPYGIRFIASFKVSRWSIARCGPCAQGSLFRTQPPPQSRPYASPNSPDSRAPFCYCLR